MLSGRIEERLVDFSGCNFELLAYQFTVALVEFDLNLLQKDRQSLIRQIVQRLDEQYIEHQHRIKQSTTAFPSVE